MVSYARLWETMKEKHMTGYRLIKYYGISAAQLRRMKKNLNVSTYTLDIFCNILKCPVEDIVEIIPDRSADSSAPSIPTDTDIKNEKSN